MAELCFNGIDPTTGKYLLPPMTEQDLAVLAQRKRPDKETVEDLKYWLEETTPEPSENGEELRNRDLRDGVDPKDLSQTGWGVIFAAEDDQAPAIRKALSPLLDHRRRQMTSRLYREYIGKAGYRRGESKQAFLERKGAGPGAVDPRLVPYYLLIVGSPEDIPYRFQHQLDVAYAVGRIHFEKVKDYAHYAESVVEAETSTREGKHRAVFFGPRHPNDPPTVMSCDQFVKPLARKLSGSVPGWRVERVLAEKADKERLRRLLGGKATPSLLFTAGHGIGFGAGDSRQPLQQGALVCDGWPGPGNPAMPDHYFTAEDLESSACPAGLVTFHFACYSAGTPSHDEFSAKGRRARVAPKSFLAGLPRQLLAHPNGGALAVVGHVDRAFEASFFWPGVGRTLQAFEDSIKRLMEGHPVGSAMEPFGRRYADLSTTLCDALQERRRRRKTTDDRAIAGMWTASNDARNYAVVGDPAVRLAVVRNGAEADGAEEIVYREPW